MVRVAYAATEGPQNRSGGDESGLNKPQMPFSPENERIVIVMCSVYTFASCKITRFTNFMMERKKERKKSKQTNKH